MDYGVMMGSRQVGRVQVLRQGLYARVICHVQMKGSILYRLVAVTGGKRENMGILIPSGDGFGLDRKIPCKRIPEENLEFLLVPSHEPAEGRFLPICPEEPFAYLDRLKEAYMEKRDGKTGIRIP